MELMRADLDPALMRGTELVRVEDGSEVEVGGSFGRRPPSAI
jgi:hypothetical protein